MVYQDNRLITLNSQDGEQINGTYLSNIRFNFSGLLQDDIYLVRTYITVLNAQFPVSFYIIDDTDNILNYKLLKGQTKSSAKYGQITWFQLMQELKVVYAVWMIVSLNLK